MNSNQSSVYNFLYLTWRDIVRSRVPKRSDLLSMVTTWFRDKLNYSKIQDAIQSHVIVIRLKTHAIDANNLPGGS